jgi:hypothetical protein
MLLLTQFSLLQEIPRAVVVKPHHKASSHQVLSKFGQCMYDGQHLLIIDGIEPLYRLQYNDGQHILIINGVEPF